MLARAGVAPRVEKGFFLIEAMVAILIFALGILGLVAMGGAAVSTQSDAQYRTAAGDYADAIAGEISLGVDRTSDVTLQATLLTFDHQANPGGDCNTFTGAPTTNATVLALLNSAANAVPGAGLPGATAQGQQILVDTANFNRVQITLCWKTASDSGWRRHSMVTYINRAGP